MDRQGEIVAHHLFGIVHPECYEALDRLPVTGEYRRRLEELLPPSWCIQRHDIWLHARPSDDDVETSPRTQGFKIHVSSTQLHAHRVLGLVVPVCVTKDVEFKIAADSGILGLLNSKLQPRGSSGKFMTIYPPDDSIFLELLEILYRTTVGEPLAGPYVLSDRRYRDSKILYYRFGGFRPVSRLNIDGTRTPMIVGPTGEPEPDQRSAYFSLPEWATDPICGVKVEPEKEAEPLLKERFLIRGALGFSNTGGIYEACDTQTNSDVVVKEARPFTNCWLVEDKLYDAVGWLEREYRVLEILAPLPFIPDPVDLFREWEHTFLVEEHVRGLRLDTFWAQPDRILAPYVRVDGTVQRFVGTFVKIAHALIDMLVAVHKRRVLIGDVSPYNILIDADTLEMHLIDFESAAVMDDDPTLLEYAARWGTAGFVDPTRANRTRLYPEDDFYSLAMTLYSCVVPATGLFTLNPSAEPVFMDQMIRMGLPAGVRAVIESLKAGMVETARKELDELLDPSGREYRRG